MLGASVGRHNATVVSKRYHDVGRRFPRMANADASLTNRITGRCISPSARSMGSPLPATRPDQLARSFSIRIIAPSPGDYIKPGCPACTSSVPCRVHYRTRRALQLGVEHVPQSDHLCHRLSGFNGSVPTWRTVQYWRSGTVSSGFR